MATYTVEQAREKWEKAGKVWSPEVEARLRERGIIQQPAAPPVVQTPADLNIPFLPSFEPVDKFTATPEWAKTYGLSKMAEPASRPFGEQMKMAVQSLAQYVPGQYGYDPQERIETGTSSGDLLVDAGLRAGSMGLLSSERLGGDAPGPITNQGQLAMSALGTGSGMIGPLRALAPAAGMVASRIVPSVAAPGTVLAAREAAMRALLGSGLTLGGYEGLMPGSAGERLSRAGHGFQTGVALAGVPAAVGASNPLARKAVEFGTMYGLGATQGMPADENLIQSIAMMLPAEALHAGQAVGGASKAAKPARQTPEQAQAAIEALEARLLNEQAPAQAEIAARVEPFRGARGALQGMEVPAAPRPEIGRPFQPEIRQVVPEGQYDRTLARIQAMRSRQAAPAPAPAPKQPLVRPPAQMEIPLDAANNRTILLRPDGTVEPAPQRPPMDVGTGTPPEKPVFTGPVIDGEPTPGTVQESMQRFNYEGSMRDAEARRTARETRGQRRARLQAEASQVNAEAQAKLDAAAATQSPPPAPAAPRPTTPRLDMMGGSQVFEAAARALKGVAVEVKDTRRRLKNIMASAETDWDAARAELAKNVDENPLSVPFSKANRDEQTYEDAVAEVVSSPRRVRKLDDLRQYPENATEGVRDIIDTDNLAALRADISKPLADRLDVAPGRDLPAKQRGFTDPIRKTQEVSDGELASAIEMSEIHGGREIEMATYKQAENYGGRYRDLKASTGITGNEQLKIAGKLLERYTSSNRGHTADDLAFVRDPEVRQLLIESGNPQGMLDYVKGVRGLMDEAGNLYNRTSKALGGDGLGDIAAYFPKVGVKPRFFEVAERLARARARKGADSRTRNTVEEVFNPRSQRRSSTDPNKVEVDGREVAREWNAETVLEGYLDTMLRGVSGDIALSQSMKAAKYDDILADRAERAGNQQEADNRRRRANVIRTLAQQKWNHQLFGVGARAEDVFKAFGAPGSMALEAVAANKRAFDNTKYRLNPRFNLVTQWTSILNPSLADPVAAMLALRDMGVPGVPTKGKKFAESTYEVRRKAMPHSQMRAQVEGTGSLAGTLSAPTTPGKKIVRTVEKVFVDGMTQGIENWANKYSALIGYHSTRNLKGLTPRQRALAAGETVFKTQSAFTFGERAGVLNSRAVQGLAPAQGYAVELANQIREALGATGVNTQLYGETNLQQARRAGAIVAAAVMQNIWQNVVFNAMRGKDVEESLDLDSIWDATVALPPFISLLLPTGKSGRDMPNPVLPVAQVNAVANKGGKVVEKAVKGEDATGAVVDLGRYVAGNWGGPGGAFASDLAGGRYDFLMDDDGADAPANTAKARPATPRSSRGRQAIPRR